MQLFKIRASGAHSIASGIIGLTGLQSLELDRLNTKDQTEKGLTDLQYEKQQDLILKRDNSELPQGAKGYVETWIKEQLYARRKEFTSKETDKGLTVEQDAIDFVAEQLGIKGLVKNETELFDDWFTGTHDTETKDTVIDVKCPWDCFTFPLFDTEVPDERYYDQGQVYMELTGKKKYKLIYCLMDTPEHIIMSIAKRESFNEGWEELNKKVYDKVKARMTYGDIPDKYRIKVFEFKYDPSRIQHLKDRVTLCRNHIEELSKADFNLKQLK